ncbi:ChrR Cupin-like domain-containing protein [Chitinophaga sp. CF118]|uniref:cupin domain-containing protein n=1 Tax=Chitinophaga sp. CF118 TaxID=1884367 RepID=UPI0008F0A93B|nr:cupin domain-containing protein [Chitinophaga sp. CF118]SFD23976.1 ChrR Cupin-like domain-containing protein [Chitinophaga sp. CF118]
MICPFSFSIGAANTLVDNINVEPGATYPYHNHPAGEEIFVISGEATLESATLSQGDYLYTPPNFKHSVTTKAGCTMLFVVPEEVEIL